MAKFNTFDQILKDPNVGSRADERVAFTREWLEANYGIEAVAKSAWVEQLSNVHDHDELPQHFGEIKVGTGFQNLWVQLVKNGSVWDLSVIKDLGDIDKSRILLPHTAKKNLTEEDSAELANLKVLLGGRHAHGVQAKEPGRFSELTQYETQQAGDEELSVPLWSVLNLEGRTYSVDIPLDDYLKKL